MCTMWCFYIVAGIWAIDLVAITSGSRTAFVEIIICENTKLKSSVVSHKLQGTFTNIGSLNNAEGDVLQIHPFVLCNISNGDALYEGEWVGVVKLTMPSQESQACNGTVQKALGAARQGAKAVIFDITDSPGAATELNAKKALIPCPIIIISGVGARKLMRIVNKQKVLRAKISWQSRVDQTKDSSSEYVDMVIFMTCFVLITLACFVLLLKIKWKQSKKESSLAKMAFDAVSRMESKKFEEKGHRVEPVKTIKEKQLERKLSIHSCSVLGISCVICLEEFKDGQEIRVVSCGHEFHLKCVDPWLLTNYTCPLCMLNIVDREGKGIKTESRCVSLFRSVFHCCLARSSISSTSMVYSVTLEDTPNDGSSFLSCDTLESLPFNPLSANSNHTLWSEHLLSNGELQESKSSSPNTRSSSVLPDPATIKTLRDIPQLSLSKVPSFKSGVPDPRETEHWKKQDNKAKAIQIAGLGIKRYAELEDAV